MAKRKKSKQSSSGSMSPELTGLVLVLIGIIGFGFGIVGTVIKEFSMFLMGTWWLVLIIYLLFIGLYMLFKRKMPKFFSKRLVGFYLLILVLLIFSHLTFLDKTASVKDILKATFDMYMERINTIDISNSILNSGDTTISIGGGLIGASFISGLYLLFGRTGTVIVASIMGIFGSVLLFNINFGNVFSKVKGIGKMAKEEFEEGSDNEEEDNPKLKIKENIEEEKKDNRVVITSLDEVKNKKEEVEVIETEEVREERNIPGIYNLPSISLLNTPKEKKKNPTSMHLIEKNKGILETTLKEFQVTGKVCDIHIGPAVTQYEVIVPAGTKVSRILSINKELALALAAKDVRIQAPIPGKSTIGIEIPNESITAVPFREILVANNQNKDKYGIMIALGKNLMGKPIVADLTKTPHLLVAGSTGSGKSVCINSIICSIFMNYRPDEVKLVLVDPKKVELSNYNGTPHLLCPVVNDPKKASITLQKIVGEMEKRYDLFSDAGVKKISEYNEHILKENKRHPESPINLMPYIVVIIDELADLMLVASKEVEDSIMRITQMARAAGIHLIVATQRPSTDVITGVVKANIPSRICFAVASGIDSRTALDMTGAEKLLGKGDMLYLPMGENTPERIQGCFISDDEINRLIEFCSGQMQAKYDETLSSNKLLETKSGREDETYDDPMYNEVVEFAIMTGKISASLIQRKFRFGFNRAARMIDLLEARGIVGPQNGSKPREVLKKLADNTEE